MPTLAGLVLVLTVPALYERYEDQIDKYVLLGYRKLMQLYVIINQEYICKVKHWIMEKQNVSWLHIYLSVFSCMWSKIKDKVYAHGTSYPPEILLRGVRHSGNFEQKITNYLWSNFLSSITFWLWWYFFFGFGICKICKVW